MTVPANLTATLFTSSSATPAATSAPPSADPYYSNVLLLLHGDGANGSSSVIDSSSVPKTITSNGVINSTAQSKLGSASLYFDPVGSEYGGGKYLSMDNIALGTGAFTIDGWIYPTTLTGTSSHSILFGGGIYGGEFFTIWPDRTVGYLNGRTEYRTTTAKISLNEWSHFAVVRSGTSIKIYINGVDVGLSIFDDLAVTISIIGGAGSAGGYYSYFGYADDLRLTAGVARYTANFNPEPTAAPTAAPTPAPTTNPTPNDATDPYYENVILSLHGDGTNGSTTFIDSSIVTKTVTTVGLVSISNADVYAGDGSIYFSDAAGSPARLDITPSTDFALGMSDFTLEGYYKVSSSVKTHTPWSIGIYGNYGSLNLGLFSQFDVGAETTTITLGRLEGNAYPIIRAVVPNSTFCNVWNHVVFQRKDTNFSIIVNDTPLYDGYAEINFAYNPLRVRIGNLNDISSPDYITSQYTYVGYMDDVRFTKGTARYYVEPAYSVAPDINAVNEGDTITWTITAAPRVVTPTTLYWGISEFGNYPLGRTISESDIVGGLTGSVVIAGPTTTVATTTVINGAPNPTAAIKFTLYEDSARTIVVAYTSEVDILDYTPPAPPTWDPTNNFNGSTLSADNLTQLSYTGYSSSGGGNGARGAIGKTSGKWYFEYKPTANIPSNQAMGVGIISNYSSNVSAFETGSNAYMWYFNSAGNISATYQNGVYAPTGSNPIGIDDIGGIAFDLDNLTIQYYKNGVLLATSSLPAGRTWYPISANGSSAAIAYGITANFGSTTLSYTPAGYIGLA